MVTPDPKPETKPLWLRLTVAEHDHIREVAHQERREVVNMVRLALDDYFQKHGYQPLPAPPLRRPPGRRPAAQ